MNRGFKYDWEGGLAEMREDPVELQHDIRNIKRTIPKDLWLKARSQAILQGKTITKWLTELISWAVETGWIYEQVKKIEGEK